jgi:hypothetical protein
MRLQTFGELLGEEQRVPRAREHRVERHRAGRPVVGVVVVPVLEEPCGRVARDERRRPDPPDRPDDAFANLGGVLELAVVHVHDRGGREPEDLRGRLGLARPRARELGSIGRGVVRASVAVRQDQEMDLSTRGAPLRERRSGRDLGVVGVTEDRDDGTAGGHVFGAPSAFDNTYRTSARTGLPVAPLGQ